MKYEVTLDKYEVTLDMHKTVEFEVEAETRDAALALAESAHPGMTATSTTGDGVTHELICKCEGCRKPIWDGDDYRTDGEGIELCLACASEGESA